MTGSGCLRRSMACTGPRPQRRRGRGTASSSGGARARGPTGSPSAPTAWPWRRSRRAGRCGRPRAADVWTVGTRVLWRGDLAEIRRAAAGDRPSVCLGADVFRVPRLGDDLRPALHARFIRLAKVELPARAWELAAQTGRDVKRVSVRDQRTRWGSCTAAGAISLNWRLILTPEFVRDYIIHHELMHLREMNHSPRFWACVGEVFPRWREAEAWIKRNGGYAGL